MIQLLFNIIINLIATIIQIIVWPINTIISNLLPDFTSQVGSITNVFNSVFDNITWALGFLPGSVITTLLFIVSVEIVKHTIYISTDKLIKVWNIFQKIKFW